MRPGLDEVKRTTSSTSWPRCCLCPVQSHLSWTRLQSWGWRLRISDSESSQLMEILLGTEMEDSMENLRLKVSCLTSIFLTCSIKTRIQSIDTAELEIFSINQIYISFFDLLSQSWGGRGSYDLDSCNPIFWHKLFSGSLRRLQGSHGGGLAMEVFEEHEGTHILQSLDGFAISLAADGRFLYISETVSIYLGLSQVKFSQEK